MTTQTKPFPSLTQRIYTTFLNLIVYPNLWVAGGIASLVLYIQLILHLPIDWRPILLIFGTALLPYNIDRIVDTYVQEIPDQRAQAFFRQPGVLGVIALAVVMTGILLYQAPPAVRWVSVGGLVPLIYGIPLIPWPQDSGWRWYRIKDIPGTKAWTVTIVVTYAIVAVPLAYAEAPLTPDVWVNIVYLVALLGSNAHMFDIRDIDSDVQAGVVTMPVLWGVPGTRLFWIICNLGSFCVLAWGWRHHLLIPDPVLALLLTSCTLGYVLCLDPDTRRSIYTIGIDGFLYGPLLAYGVLTLLARLG